MKNLLSFLIILLLHSCHGSHFEKGNFPQAFFKMLINHGGLNAWQKKKSLQFQVTSSDGVETHAVDLKNYRDRVDGPGYSMGYDGQAVWVSNDTTFKGNPVLYHNLYFYFFSMPFMLAEEGVDFSEAAPLYFEGREYPGYQVTLSNGVGTGLSDKFFIHYNPTSHYLAWVGYADPYLKEKINWVKYCDWIHTERLILPKQIAWYKTENGELTEPRHQVTFDKIDWSGNVCRNDAFERPEGAVVVE